MLFIKSLQKGLVNGSLYGGTMATVITLGDKNKGKIQKPDYIIDKIKEFGLSTVFIRGNVIDNPDIKPLIIGLVSISYNIIVEVDSSSSAIEPLRNIRKVNFLLNTTPPNEKVNDLNMRNFQMIKADDEVLFTIKDEKDYNEVIYFLKNTLIVKPLISFAIPKGDEKLLDNIMNYSSKLLCRSRILYV